MERATYSSGEGELQVISTKGVVMDGRLDDLLEELGFAEQVLRDPQPQSEELFRSMSAQTAGGQIKETDSPASSKSYDRMARCPASTSSPPWPTGSGGYS